MYKANSKMLPKNLQLMFKDSSSQKTYSLRNKHDCHYKYVRTKQKQMCLSIYGIKLWNSMQNEIKYSKTIISFKSKYKLYLLNQY